VCPVAEIDLFSFLPQVQERSSVPFAVQVALRVVVHALQVWVCTATVVSGSLVVSGSFVVSETAGVSIATVVSGVLVVSTDSIISAVVSAGVTVSSQDASDTHSVMMLAMSRKRKNDRFFILSSIVD
jgi:hypothetical protein